MMSRRFIPFTLLLFLSMYVHAQFASGKRPGHYSRAYDSNRIGVTFTPSVYYGNQGFWGGQVYRIAVPSLGVFYEHNFCLSELHAVYANIGGHVSIGVTRNKTICEVTDVTHGWYKETLKARLIPLTVRIPVTISKDFRIKRKDNLYVSPSIGVCSVLYPWARAYMTCISPYSEAVNNVNLVSTDGWHTNNCELYNIQPCIGATVRYKQQIYSLNYYTDVRPTYDGIYGMKPYRVRGEHVEFCVGFNI